MSFSKRRHGINTRKHYFILSCQASTQRNLLNLNLQFSCQGGGILTPGYLCKPTFSSVSRPGHLKVPDVKRTCLLSSYPRNFIHLFIHSQVKFLWLFSLTYTLMCSLLWPGHLIFFIVVLVIGDYFIGLETLYLAKQVEMINGKFAFVIFFLDHNFVRKATTRGLEFFWFLNYLNAQYR